MLTTYVTLKTTTPLTQEQVDILRTALEFAAIEVGTMRDETCVDVEQVEKPQ